MTITVTTDTLWTSPDPIVLTENVRIENGATLTLANGTVLDGNGFRIETVDGALRAQGGGGVRIELRDVTLAGDDVVLEKVDMYRGSLGLNGDMLRIADSTFRDVENYSGWHSGIGLRGGSEVTGSLFVHSTPLTVYGDEVTVSDNWFLFQEGLYFYIVGSADGITISDNSFATGPQAYAYSDALVASYQGEIQVTGTHLYGFADGDYADRFLDHSQVAALSWEIVDEATVSTGRVPPITIHDAGSIVEIGEDHTSLIGPHLEYGYSYSINDGAFQIEEGSWLYFALWLPQSHFSFESSEIGFAPYQVTTRINDELGTIDSLDVSQLAGTAFLPAIDLDSEPTEFAYIDIELSGEYFGGDTVTYQVKVEVLDKAIATEFADFLIGNVLANDIAALGGDDTIWGGPGDDIIDGGSGVDTANYDGPQKSYTLSLSPSGTTVDDRRAGGSGTDTLINIELVDFEAEIPILAGQALDLRVFGGPTNLSAPDFESFIELYIAYFNRAPDAIGLNFWGTAFANGTTLEDMAALFGPQEETLAAYPPGTSNQVFATTVYSNVLGRTPDQAGIDFWVGQLDAGHVSRDQFILSVLQGAKADLKPELGQDFVDQQLADQAYLENKIEIGAYFAVHKGMSDVSNAVSAMALFDGTDTSITAAVSAIDGYYASALDPVDGEFLMPIIGVLDDPFAMA